MGNNYSWSLQIRCSHRYLSCLLFLIFCFSCFLPFFSSFTAFNLNFLSFYHLILSPLIFFPLLLPPLCLTPNPFLSSNYQLITWLADCTHIHTIAHTLPQTLSLPYTNTLYPSHTKSITGKKYYNRMLKHGPLVPSLKSYEVLLKAMSRAENWKEVSTVYTDLLKRYVPYVLSCVVLWYSFFLVNNRVPILNTVFRNNICHYY